MSPTPRPRRSPSAPRRSGAPRLAPIVLPDLSEGLLSDLEPSSDLDGLLIEGIELDHLDLSGASVRECRLAGVSAAKATWRGTTVADTVIEGLNVPVFAAVRGGWRDVTIEASRLGSAEMYEAKWQSVQLSQCRLGYVNLRGAALWDVALTDCTIDELDLGGAELHRVSFAGTRVGRLDVQRATLADVDLRGLDFREIAGVANLAGATIDGTQLALLAPLLADQVGLTVAG